MQERDERGRFVKGHSGNPKGRAPKSREERYYEIAISAVTFAQWRNIIEKAAQQAERGDATARRFLADLFLPTPAQRFELTGALGGPIQITEADEIRAELKRKLLQVVESEPEG